MFVIPKAVMNSIKLIVTIKASREFKGSFAYLVNPYAIIFKIISMAKNPVNTKLLMLIQSRSYTSSLMSKTSIKVFRRTIIVINMSKSYD